MSVPIIRSVTAYPDTVQRGQAAQVTIDAVDPDARVVTLTGRVKDPAGHEATAVTVLTVGSGPLTYELTTDDPAVKIVADPAAPGQFTVVPV
ncbi:hypothetical protein ABZ671_00935 [Micromonospora sp. NPDC006766]|uniref:hypothetical protein n=1 Tax=Micromonospora sp. NPDC006766 TaxID=3154778 RepID=UPI0033C7C4B9